MNWSHTEERDGETPKAPYNGTLRKSGIEETQKIVGKDR
jgi:hypothetical protein